MEAASEVLLSLKDKKQNFMLYQSCNYKKPIKTRLGVGQSHAEALSEILGILSEILLELRVSADAPVNAVSQYTLRFEKAQKNPDLTPPFLGEAKSIPFHASEDVVINLLSTLVKLKWCQAGILK